MCKLTQASSVLMPPGTWYTDKDKYKSGDHPPLVATTRPFLPYWSVLDRVGHLRRSQNLQWHPSRCDGPQEPRVGDQSGRKAYSGRWWHTHTHTSLCVCVYVGGLGEREALHPAGVIDIDRLMHLPLNPQNTWGIVGEDMRWKRTWQRLT